MANYFLILTWPAVAAFLASISGGRKTENICGRDEIRYKYIWVIIASIPLILFAANRGNVGDTYSYQDQFMNMPDELSGLSDYMNTVTKDELFYFTSALIKIFVTGSPKIYFAIVATMQIIIILSVYRKYSDSLFMSFFLFLISSDYLSWMFNGIRQFVAVCLTFACFSLILKKKYIPAIIIVSIASFFHGTAFIVIPFMFIAQGKAWNKKTVLFIMGVILAVTFIDQFTDILDSLLVDTQYTSVVSDWTDWNDDGTNILRVIVYCIPALLSLCGKNKIREANNPVINLCVNMSIASAGIYVVSMFTSGIFIGRLPIYFSLYGYILLPWEIKNLFSDSVKQIVNFVMIAAYIVFYLYNLRYSFGLI